MDIHAVVVVENTFVKFLSTIYIIFTFDFTYYRIVSHIFTPGIGIGGNKNVFRVVFNHTTCNSIVQPIAPASWQTICFI